MASMIEINLRPDERTLRQFGWIALAGFGFLAAIAWFELLIFGFGLGAARLAVAGGFAGLAAVSALFSLVWPRANLPIYLGLTVLAFPIGFVLSYVILGLLYFAVIAPTGLLMRAFGNDPLHRKAQADAESYWVDARPARPSKSYFQQF